MPEEMCFVEPNSLRPLLSASTAGDESSALVDGVLSGQSETPLAKANKQNSRKVKAEETALLDEKLSDFIFGCDIPFSVIESTNFRNLIAALRPSYAPKLPSRHKLATQLLDAACDRCATENRQQFHDQPSVLVIDEWRRSEYGSSNVLVSLLQNAGAGKERIFLKAQHVTNDDDDRFYASFVRHSLSAAKRTYATHVYAVVGDRVVDSSAAQTDALWYSPCYLGLANALAHDLFDQELDEKVTFVLRQFKRASWHQALTQAGGQSAVLPRCNSWRSYHESYVNFARNARFMKAVVDDATFEPGADCASQRELTRELLRNDQFVESVEKHASVLEPVCQLIETCGRSDAGLADAVHAWLQVRFDKNPKFERVFERRRSAALTKYALAAYFLHPKRVYYEHCSQMARAKDGAQRTYFTRVRSFLRESLDSWSMQVFYNFVCGLDFMKPLLALNIENATVFWRMVESHHSPMAHFAQRLLRIPASASRIDNQFYSRSYVHDTLAAAADDSPVALERCEKLLRVYYNRKSPEIASQPDF